MRQELAGLETDVALCERCYGPERRLTVRYARPPAGPRILLLGERPPRSVLQSEERLGLANGDAGTRFLAGMLREAEIPEEHVLLGAAVMCRPASRRLEAALGEAVCVRECARHVRELVRLAAPRLVVPLGKVALRSLRMAFPEHENLQRLRFPESVAAVFDATRFHVFPLYHVTARARLHRDAAQQRQDWRKLGRVWKELGGTAAPADGGGR